MRLPSASAKRYFFVPSEEVNISRMRTGSSSKRSKSFSRKEAETGSSESFFPCMSP